MASAGSTVTVFVSAGQHQRAVPDVVGEDVSAARSKIVNAGLNPVVKTDTTSTAPANTVVRQSPAAGTAVNSGRVATIYVSRGGTAVQDVTGDRPPRPRASFRGGGSR
jgi:eukaryotic-like serine/threonine-protein kinase